MRNATFYKVFLEFIQDIYDAENQIVEALPTMISHCNHPDLKKGLSQHLEETKEQVNRLEQIFTLLEESPTRKPCAGMKGLLEEGKEILEKNNLTKSVKDCFIIIAAQKVEHYEIASYGSAIALVDHMECACENKDEWKEICDLLNKTLKEEKASDEKLTKVAEGSLFIKGVNEEIEKEISVKA